MFSVREKRRIADGVQVLLRRTGHPELPTGEITFHLHVAGSQSMSWADIENNGAIADPSVNPHNERQDSDQTAEFNEDLNHVEIAKAKEVVPQTAEERGMKLFAMPMPDTPQLAKDFAKHLVLTRRTSAPGSTYRTAFVVYAQCVEGLACTDPVYLARECDREWFEKQQAERAIAAGTIAKAEAAADVAEQVASHVGDRVSEDAPAEEPLDDPWDIMAEYLRVMVEAIASRDWHSKKVRSAAKLAPKLFPKLQADRVAEVKALNDALWETVTPGAGLDDAEEVSQ